MVLAISTRQSQHGFQHLGGHEHGFLTTGWPPSRCRGLASHAATCHTAYHGELAGEHSAAQRSAAQAWRGEVVFGAYS